MHLNASAILNRMIRIICYLSYHLLPYRKMEKTFIFGQVTPQFSQVFFASHFSRGLVGVKPVVPGSLPVILLSYTIFLCFLCLIALDCGSLVRLDVGLDAFPAPIEFSCFDLACTLTWRACPC